MWIAGWASRRFPAAHLPSCNAIASGISGMVAAVNSDVLVTCMRLE
jgi:hypothetical protein